MVDMTDTVNAQPAMETIHARCRSDATYRFDDAAGNHEQGAAKLFVQRIWGNLIAPASVTCLGHSFDADGNTWVTTGMTWVTPASLHLHVMPWCICMYVSCPGTSASACHALVHLQLHVMPCYICICMSCLAASTCHACCTLMCSEQHYCPMMLVLLAALKPVVEKTYFISTFESPL